MRQAISLFKEKDLRGHLVLDKIITPKSKVEIFARWNTTTSKYTAHIISHSDTVEGVIQSINTAFYFEDNVEVVHNNVGETRAVLASSVNGVFTISFRSDQNIFNQFSIKAQGEIATRLGFTDLTERVWSSPFHIFTSSRQLFYDPVYIVSKNALGDRDFDTTYVGELNETSINMPIAEGNFMSFQTNANTVDPGTVVIIKQLE